MRCVFGIVAVLFGAFLAAGAAAAGDCPFPAAIDPAKRYVIYMHGAYVEKKGPNDQYDVYGILDALEAKGFVVIGEARGRVGFGQYAEQVAAQVRRLLDAGVPVGHILVAGHSKGGFIALFVAARLGDPAMRYGILAACGVKGSEFYSTYRHFLERDAGNVKGTFLVMWDKADTVARDCDAAMNAAADATHENTVLTTGRGHQLFYRPDPAWIDPLVAFAAGK